MTTYRQVNETDYWNVNEIHAGPIKENYWCFQAKLPNGRVAMMFKECPRPEEKDEPQLLQELIRKDKRDHVKEWFAWVWRELTRCHLCHCDDCY